MARPRKQGLDYFPHDVDASNDEKIEALRALYGNDGYAFYFILLERIYRTINAELDLSKPAILAAIIKKIGITLEKFNEMIETAFEVGCFCREKYEADCILTSSGIKRRHTKVQEMRERWREVKEDGVFHVENHAENREENAEVTGESKEKKSKEKKKESKGKSTPPITPPKHSFAEFVSLTNAEHKALVAKYGEAGTLRIIEILDNYKGSTGKRYKSDYRTILNWVVQRYEEERYRKEPTIKNMPRGFAGLYELAKEHELS